MRTEIETKLELRSKEIYELLLNSCRQKTRLEQLNVYYDHAGQLAEQAATFRLRYQVNARIELTLKIPMSNEAGCRSAIEIEESYTRWRKPAQTLTVSTDLAPSFQQYLGELGLSVLERIGAMRTSRIVLELIDGIEIELDKITLPDGSTVYEVEIENVDPTIHEFAMTEIKRITSEFNLSKESKYQRFMRVVTSRKSIVQSQNSIRA